MATTYKSLSTNDIVTTKTLLHEAIPITGTILSGTYKSGATELSIKNYTHGMFQSVYDYPYLSSSANHIFDISMGFASTSGLSGSANMNMYSKKTNVYNQMAQVLMGYDENGNIRKFDEDGDLSGSTQTHLTDVIFLNFARLLTKDEIKKGSFELELGVTTAHNLNGTAMAANRIKIQDVDAQNDYRVNSPAGDYGILYAGESTGGTVLDSNAQAGTQTTKAGLIFYQAGVVVLSSSIFQDVADGGILDNGLGSPSMDGSKNIRQLFVSGAMSASADAVRQRIHNVQFNNTTELNSTVYFCRAHHNEFNYSTNPTYLSASQLIVKNNASDTPVSYITTVGLYSADNELLAVAKLSEPLKKDPSNELTMRVRLDY